MLDTNRPEGWVRADREWVRSVWAWVRNVHGYKTTEYRKIHDSATYCLSRFPLFRAKSALATYTWTIIYTVNNRKQIISEGIVIQSVRDSIFSFCVIEDLWHTDVNTEKQCSWRFFFTFYAHSLPTSERVFRRTDQITWSSNSRRHLRKAHFHWVKDWLAVIVKKLAGINNRKVNDSYLLWATNTRINQTTLVAISIFRLWIAIFSQVN